MYIRGFRRHEVFKDKIRDTLGIKAGRGVSSSARFGGWHM
jgi:hypothetical protein